MTNADKIRNMTDEQLSEFLSDRFDCDVCPCSYIEEIDNCIYCECTNGNTCVQVLLDWLKQEAKDN